MGRERIREKMRMIRFADAHHVSREDMYNICQGRFDEWFFAYEAYCRFEFRRRIETGYYRPINIEDVWGGSQWTPELI